MNSPTIAPLDIERWFPSNFDQIVGCAKLKAILSERVLCPGKCSNLLIYGPSGSGKTASVKTYMRTLICPHRPSGPPRPCGGCRTCKEFDVRYADYDMFAIASYRSWVCNCEPIHYWPINCGSITEAELREMVRSTYDCHGHRVIYLDEAHRLAKRRMDEMLLKPLEEIRAVWIASTARADELDPMFIRRFATRVSTELPSLVELVNFLADRCVEWGIRCPDPATLVALAHKCGQTPSECLAVLARAAETPGRVLNTTLVDQHVCFNSVASQQP